MTAVDVTIHNSAGNPYSGKVLVRMSRGHMVVFDGEYFGFSGVAFLASDYQNRLNTAASANPNTPVSALVQQMMNEKGFIHCP